MFVEVFDVCKIKQIFDLGPKIIKIYENFKGKWFCGFSCGK